VHSRIAIAVKKAEIVNERCPEARVRFPALPDFLKKKTVAGLERGPLSLVSTTEELLDRKVAAPV
jgi:hypothetical protein